MTWERLRFFVVDDDDIALQAQCALLRAAGHEVVGHVDAASAIPDLMRRVPDAILIDVVMARASRRGRRGRTHRQAAGPARRWRSGAHGARGARLTLFLLQDGDVRVAPRLEEFGDAPTATFDHRRHLLLRNQQVLEPVTAIVAEAQA